MKRWMTAAWTLGLLLSPALAEVATDCFSAGGHGPHPKAIRIDGKQMTVKLDGLPEGAKVHAARLYASRGEVKSAAERMVDVQIHPGTSAEGKPLQLIGPWRDCLDATAAVRKAAGGELKLFVKAFGEWEQSKTRLEVMYEGRTAKPPRPVKGLKVFHRAGQTFITWKEVDPLVASEKCTWGEYRKALASAEGKGACTYRVYAHDRPITADSIAKATLLADVAPLSCWNANGRNMEYLIAQSMRKEDALGECTRGMRGWGPFSERMDRYPLARFVIDDKAGPLPAGTGLYVHSPTRPGKTYYAVVSCRHGVQNTSDFSAGSAASRPVAETVGPGEPVCQGDGLWGPFFDYKGRRKVYVQWAAPPLCPRPSMYFNWSVLVPPSVAAKSPFARLRAGRAQVELYFHGGNYSYAKPLRKYLHHSIQIAPHDFPASGWYGFNDAWGSLTGYRAGTVGNHTQRRIVAFLDWAQKAFPIDPDRIMLPGGDGAALLALNYPEKFSYVVITRFSAAVLDPKQAAAFEAIWGPKSPLIKDEQGRADWGWAMLDKLVLARPQRDLPLFAIMTKSWGLHVRKFGRGEGRLFDALRKTGQAFHANWSWGGGPPLMPDRYTGLWRGLQMTRNTPLLAFANCTSDGNRDGNGNANVWCTWAEVKETPDEFRATLAGRGSADVAVRRCRHFKLRPGQKLNWRAVPRPSRRGREPPEPQSGQVTADANGLARVKAVRLSRGGVDFKITLAK